MALKASGISGEVRKGYQVAARLSSWTLESDTSRVDATATERNPFWLEQNGLSLHLTLGNRQWVWREIEIMDSGHPFAIRIHGQPDVKM
jgi:hypothetical protein